MFERFEKPTSAKVVRAGEIAAGEGAATIEADHLLMALVDPVDDVVGEMLHAAGISAAAIRDARDREFRSALESVGVSTTRPAPVGSARLRRGRATRFGQSAKLALERTAGHARVHGDRGIGNEHLMLAVIGAEVGATPQLLAELGTTSEELIARLEAATSA